jgi:methionyl-tRNA synthetase
MSDNKFYLTTPIYYVNARPHIGHAYTTIVADVLARRHRLLGEDTFFLTGTDEHGQKIERSAAAAGIPPQQFADDVSKTFSDLWKRMGITNDAYIRTTDAAHAKGVQKLFSTLYEKGYIYLASYTGSYCVSDEAFVDATVGTPCPDCGRLLEEVTEENFFFKLSEFGDRIAALIESNELLITPDSRRNEVLSFVKGGLKDLSISRSSFTWGIPVPEPAASTAAQKHVIYVWLDALANYITALGYGSDDESNFKKFWPADLHLVGKEIIRFHCVYWPAFLLAADIALPKQITAHGWLLFDNSKMSKSKGNIVRTETILDGFGTLCPPVQISTNKHPDVPDEFVHTPNEIVILTLSLPKGKDLLSTEAPQPSTESDTRKGTASAVPITAAQDAALAAEVRPPTKPERDLFATDILRYFLLREIPFGQDGSFSFEAMITRYNADLANGYGNLVSRVLAMISKSFDGAIPDGLNHNDPSLMTSEKYAAVMSVGLENLANHVKANRFQSELEWIASYVTGEDRTLSERAPWKLKEPRDRVQLAAILYTTAESIRLLTARLYPILPYATAKVWAQLGLGDIELAARNGELKNLEWGGLKPGTKLGPLSPIFPRADKGLIDIMTDLENPTSKLDNSKLETQQAPATFDPAAAPRTGAPDAAPLTVAGSHATTTGPSVISSHADAQTSGIFAHETPKAAGPVDASPQIAIDDFVKIELRVAEVLLAERIPKADKLLRLEVDLGYEKRQILSGIAEFYTPEELVGRRIIVITNLAPRKMRGLESHGMLLAASEEGGKPFLATVPEGVPVGTRLK